MMSVAGGWFFLMACEMFVLGSLDFRLPGLGSYLQTAASAGDTQAILWGVGTMIAVIVLLDQIVWRPVIAWAEKFKMEQVESTDAPKSWFLNLIQRSRLLIRLRKRVIILFANGWRCTTRASLTPRTKKLRRPPGKFGQDAPSHRWQFCRLLCGGARRGHARRTEYLRLQTDPGRDGGNVWPRDVALIIGSLWTIPVGVAIGFNPRLARIAQPLAQIAASVPATALFPIVLLVLIRIGGGLGLGSIVLLLLGTQWYILFNVIAGAMAIPTDLKEASSVFKFNRGMRWRKLILPGIFPYLVTGLVTASGGAWNASIVAEYFRLKDHTYTTVGLGATISRATDSGNFALLLGSTIVMALVVVTVNRLVWRRMYRLAANRYTLEV